MKVSSSGWMRKKNHKLLQVMSCRKGGILQDMEIKGGVYEEV